MTKTYGIDYSKGKIYKIVCNVTGLIYVGSTTKEYLSQRLTQHRGDYQKYLKGKRNNITSFEILKNGNYDIILLESVLCNSKDELHARERYYIETLTCVNKCIPGQTHKEYYQKNKDKQREYYENNKEKIREYYEINKDKILGKKREYEQNNKEKKREYYENNKREIIEKRKEKFTCECGRTCRKSDRAEHFRTKKHIDFISQSNDAIVAI